MGGLFRSDGIPHSKVIEVGAVPVLDGLPADARAQVDRVLTISRSNDLDSALAKVRRGDDAAAIEQRGDQVIVHYSAADATSAGTVRTVMASLVQAANLAESGRPARFTVADALVENASLKQIQYLTPGILGWAIATGATFAAASSLVIWRQRRVLRRLNLSPIGIRAVIGARVVVSLGIALAQTAIFIAVAALFFGLKLAHSWWVSIPLVLAGTLAFLAIGLLAGAKAKSIETASAFSNLIVIPMAFLSGSFFPLSLAPPWLQRVAEVLPLRHLNVGMLDVLARGAGPASVLPELAILLGFAVVVTAVAVRLFRWDDD
jgi:ABC-2 type transport system permease protein